MRLKMDKYKQANKNRAHQRYLKIRNTLAYKEQHRNVMQQARKETSEDLPKIIKRQMRIDNGQHFKKIVNAKGKTLTKQQKYWIRRSQRMAIMTQQKIELTNKQKMHRQSGVFPLDISLLYNKAQQRIKCGKAKVRRLHTKLLYTRQQTTCNRFQLIEHQPLKTLQLHLAEHFTVLQVNLTTGSWPINYILKNIQFQLMRRGKHSCSS
jgi:hypothetical protein